jgi:hypothetical protein
MATSPNALANIQVRMSDIPILLDALELALEEFDENLDCDNEGCAGCMAHQGALFRMRDIILNQAPFVEVE